MMEAIAIYYEEVSCKSNQYVTESAKYMIEDIIMRYMRKGHWIGHKWVEPQKVYDYYIDRYDFVIAMILSGYRYKIVNNIIRIFTKSIRTTAERSPPR